MALQLPHGSSLTAEGSVPGFLPSRAATATTVVTEAATTMSTKLSLANMDLFLQSLAETISGVGESMLSTKGSIPSQSLTISKNSDADTQCPPEDQPQQHFHSCPLACHVIFVIDFIPNDNNCQTTYVHGPGPDGSPAQWDIRNCACSVSQTPDANIDTCQASFDCILDKVQQMRMPLPASVQAYVDQLVDKGHAKPSSKGEEPETSNSIWQLIDLGGQWVWQGRWLLLVVPVGLYVKHCGGLKEAIADLKRRYADLARRMQQGRFFGDRHDDVVEGGRGSSTIFEMSDFLPGSQQQGDPENPDA